MKKNKKQIGFRVNEKDYNSLEKLAESMDMTISYIMRKLIRKFLKKEISLKEKL